MQLKQFRCRRFAVCAAAAAVLVMAIATLIGCTGGSKPSKSKPPAGGAGAVVGRVEHLSVAVEFLNSLDSLDAGQAHPQILLHLNQWLAKQKAPQKRPIDPLFARLPKRLADVASPNSLQRLRFEMFDIVLLREAVWMRDIAQAEFLRMQRDLRTERSAARDGEELMAPWLAEIESSLGPKAVDDLRLAERLFDWTVRNIQLDPMPPIRADSGGPASDRAGPELVGKGGRPLVKAFPGPGTERYAWEALLIGHGDALQRARIFILLARQRGIDVVMLKPDRDKPTAGSSYGPSRSTLAAVRIEKRLYLFDTTLGLPIPGPGGEGIATLAQVSNDPQILRSLDLDKDHRYWISSAELGGAGAGPGLGVVAYIDADPASLSQRMAMLEARLSGEEKMVLTTWPSLQAEQLRRCKGIADVRLWTLPYEAIQYQLHMQRLIMALQQAQQDDNDQAAQRLLKYFDPGAFDAWQRESQPFLQLNPLMRGRLLQFRGQFDTQEQTRGAKAFYLKCRPPDAEIDELENREWQQQMVDEGKLPKDDRARARYIQELRQHAVERKQQASYWLGLIAYEEGNYSVAIDFFKIRTLEASPDGPWTPGARYNLGRCYEQTSEMDKAAVQYRTDESPQRHGNLLRARRLEKRILSKDVPQPK